MSSARSIKSLARSAGITPERALMVLGEAGLAEYSKVTQLVSQARLPAAEFALGLRAAPVREESRLINELTDAVRAPFIGPTAPLRSSKAKPQRSHATDRGRPLRHQYDLPPVGRPPGGAIRHLTIRAVLDIHEQLVRDFSSSGDPIVPSGARDDGRLLESALTRPQTSAGNNYKYPTVAMAAAALLHGLVHDHPFHNGNKRTAIVSLLVFLDMNGYVLRASEDALFQYVLDLSSHETTNTPQLRNKVLSKDDAETTSAASWIDAHSRKLNRSQRALTWRDLSTILRGYDCEFEKRGGNSIMIRRGSLTVHAGARNEGDEIDVSGIDHIRKGLELDEPHGIDSDSFYYNTDVVPGFINRYRMTLRKLAHY